MSARPAAAATAGRTSGSSTRHHTDRGDAPANSATCGTRAAGRPGPATPGHQRQRHQRLCSHDQPHRPAAQGAGGGRPAADPDRSWWPIRRGATTAPWRRTPTGPRPPPRRRNSQQHRDQRSRHSGQQRRFHRGQRIHRYRGSTDRRSEVDPVGEPETRRRRRIERSTSAANGSTETMPTAATTHSTERRSAEVAARLEAMRAFGGTPRGQLCPVPTTPGPRTRWRPGSPPVPRRREDRTASWPGSTSRPRWW